MKKIYILLILVISLFTISACDDILDTKGDIYLTPEMLETQYEQMFSFGYKTYTNVINGFTRIDNNLFAAVSDEAQNVTPISDTQRFNEGSWNAFIILMIIMQKHIGEFMMLIFILKILLNIRKFWL